VAVRQGFRVAACWRLRTEDPIGTGLNGPADGSAGGTAESVLGGVPAGPAAPAGPAEAVVAALGGLQRRLAGWAAATALAPVSVSGISLALGICAAVWFTAGTAAASLRGALALCAAYFATVGARELASQPGGVTAWPSARSGRRASWLGVLATRAGEYAALVGLAIGAGTGGRTGMWPLAVAVLSLVAVRDAMTACGARGDSGSRHGPARHGAARHGSARSAAAAIMTMPAGGRVLLIAVAAPLWGARATLAGLLDFAVITIGYGIFGMAATRRRDRQPAPERRQVMPEPTSLAVLLKPAQQAEQPEVRLLRPAGQQIPVLRMQIAPPPAEVDAHTAPASYRAAWDAGHADPDETAWAGQADAGRADTGLAGLGLYGPPDPVSGPAEPGPAQFGTGQYSTGQYGTEQYGADQNGTEQYGADQNGAGQFGAEQTDPVNASAVPFGGASASPASASPASASPASASTASASTGSASTASPGAASPSPPRAGTRQGSTATGSTATDKAATGSTATDGAKGVGNPAVAVVLRCRDDGRISRWFGRLVQGHLPPLPPALLALAAVAMLAHLGLADLPGALILAPAIVMLLAAPGSSHRHDGRLDWLVPAVLMGAQFVYIVALGVAAAVPELVTFSLCAVIALRYADLASGGSPVLPARRAAAVVLASPGPAAPVAERGAWLGWDGRMIFCGLGAAMGVTMFAYLALGAYVGGLICWKIMTSRLAAGEGECR
jgi:hypothetical protein